MTTDIGIHIIYLRSGPVLLSKKPYADWRAIQADYPDYMTSLGPWEAEDVIEFFSDEYASTPGWPFSREEIAAFVRSAAEVCHQARPA